MNLKQLAAKPKLVKITLDDENTLAEYSEPLEFYIYDRQPVGVFIKMAGTTFDNLAEIVKIVNDLILDADGNPIVTGEEVLPQKLYIRVIEKVVKQLGE